MRKRLHLLLFLGAAWGLCEATLGFALHRLAVLLPGVPGALMFPVAFFWMHRAYRATGSAAAPLAISVVAALAKTVDFILPGADPLRVANPALSILLEGLAVTGVYALKARIPHVASAFLMGVLWRAAFAGWLYLISLFNLPAALVTGGPATLMRFIVVESAVNALVIRAGFYAARVFPKRISLNIGPAASAAACFAALAAHALLR